MKIPSLHFDSPFAGLPSAFESLRASLPDAAASRSASMIAAASRGDWFDDYCEAAANDKHDMEMIDGTGIALQPVVGTILDGVDCYYEAFCGYFDASRVCRAAERAASDTSIRALVLVFDSPGGYTSGVEDAYAALLQLRTARPSLPVLAYVAGNCCSAAAWIAAGCASRHSGRRGNVGGVGNYIVTVDASRYYAAAGIEVRLYADGIYKGLGAEGVPWPDEWYNYISGRVADVSRRIKGAVSAACPLVAADWMQGQAFTPPELLESGQVGPGHFLDSVPDLAGNGGYPSLERFLADLVESLKSAPV